MAHCCFSVSTAVSSAWKASCSPASGGQKRQALARRGTAGGGDRHAGVDRQTALLAEPDDSLGGIHRRAAAEADHHLRTQGLHLRYPFRHGVNGRIRCNIAEHADAVAGGQRGAQSVKQRRARQEAVADDPDVLMAKALQRGQAARAAVEARLQRKGMHGAPG